MAAVIAVLLVVVSFSLKFLIAQKPSKSIFLSCLFELPMDIIFLSMGCVASFIIADTDRYKDAFVFFLVQLIVALGVFALCRAAIDLFESSSNAITTQNKWTLILFTTSSHLLSIVTYGFSILYFLGV